MITLLLPIDANQVFERCLKAHQALASASVFIAYRGQKGKATYTMTYERPTTAGLTVDSASLAVAPTRRLYSITKQQFLAVEPGTGRYIVRTLPDGTLDERLRFVLGGLDDLVGFVLSPSPGFLSRFKAARPWKVTNGGHNLIFAQGRRRLEFTVDPSWRVSGLTASIGNQVETWSVTYGSLVPAKVTAPPNGLLVDSFRDQKPDPKFADKVAAEAIRRATRRYSLLSPTTYRTSDEGSEFLVTVSANRFRQDQGAHSWEFAGGQLLILDARAKRAYTGPCRPHEVLKVLRRVYGLQIEPFLRQLVDGINPTRQLLGPDLKVRSVGVGVLDGTPTDLLEATGKGAVISLAVRKNDGLIASLAYKTLDNRGRKVYQNERQLTYQGPLGRLQIPSGYSSAPLPTKQTNR